MHEFYRKVLKELKRVVMATIGLNEGLEGMGRLKLLRESEGNLTLVRHPSLSSIKILSLQYTICL